MSRSPRPLSRLEFVQTFVDALTIRPFLQDLRRARRIAESPPRLAAVSRDPPTRFDSATAA